MPIHFCDELMRGLNIYIFFVNYNMFRYFSTQKCITVRFVAYVLGA